MTQFRRYLETQHLKPTQQRDAIARNLFEAGGHITIADLLERVRVVLPNVGYATVYRTLKHLTACGLAAERHFSDGQTTFEVAGDTEHHDHLICLECGYVLEFHNEVIERAQEAVARSFGFDLVRHKHELYGLCPRARGIKNGFCQGRSNPHRTPPTRVDPDPDDELPS